MIAGYYDVPVEMLSGDDVICREVEEWLPGIEAAIVKYGLNGYAATCLPMEEARKMIKAGASRIGASASITIITGGEGNEKGR